VLQSSARPGFAGLPDCWRLIARSHKDARYAEATNLIASYPKHPLRTLDALHLTLAADLGVSMLGTADGVMPDAAVSMG
jgi:hypothetical protein